MSNFLEALMEKLIGDGVITEQELEQRITEFKEQSAVVNLQDDNAELLMQNAIMDARVESLEHDSANMLLAMAGGENNV